MMFQYRIAREIRELVPFQSPSGDQKQMLQNSLIDNFNAMIVNNLLLGGFGRLRNDLFFEDQKVVYS